MTVHHGNEWRSHTHKISEERPNFRPAVGDIIKVVCLQNGEGFRLERAGVPMELKGGDIIRLNTYWGLSDCWVAWVDTGLSQSLYLGVINTALPLMPFSRVWMEGDITVISFCEKLPDVKLVIR